MTDTTNRTAAIWARVSTDFQQTLESQVARAKAELEKRGYIVPPDRILMVDWTSLDLFHCPQFQQLRGWIVKREIGAVGIFDRDRLNAIGLQRLVFLSECRDNGVELVICQGPPVLNEPEGQLVELALAIGKERQVLRAQQGSRDALRERALVKGLPTTCQSPYGYSWDQSRTRLIANQDWEIRALIVELFLQGKTIKGIVKELAQRGIPSPKGKSYWVEPTIALILKDTVNYGEYRALRRESVEPKRRKGATYGKSSTRYLPGIVLPNIVVEKPITTREEHQWILQKLEHNRMTARRNCRRDYLLRGMIQYEGDNIRYYGSGIGKISWGYRYSVRGTCRDNPRPYLPGPRLEKAVEARAREVLTSDAVLEQELGWRAKAVEESMARLEAEQKRLERKQNENINAESELAGLRIRGQISDEAYLRQRGLLLAERKWIAERAKKGQEELEHLKSLSRSRMSLEQLRSQVAHRLGSSSFADRRFILEALGTRVIVTTEGALEVEFTIGQRKSEDGAIALNVPLNACPRC
jgi:site-specific DNA recombinase